MPVSRDSSFSLVTKISWQSRSLIAFFFAFFLHLVFCLSFASGSMHICSCFLSLQTSFSLSIFCIEKKNWKSCMCPHGYQIKHKSTKWYQGQKNTNRWFFYCPWLLQFGIKQLRSVGSNTTMVYGWRRWTTRTNGPSKRLQTCRHICKWSMPLCQCPDSNIFVWSLQENILRVLSLSFPCNLKCWAGSLCKMRSVSHMPSHA